MDTKDFIYEGKAKQLLYTDDINVVIQRFKDSATAFNGQKKAEFPGKGATNNALTSFFFEKLEEAHVPTHFIEHLNARDMKVHKLEIVPLEVVVRNVVAGSLSKRTGVKEGTPIKSPIVETYYKKDELGDPILADAHVFMLELLTPEQLKEIKRLAGKVNDVLRPLFKEAGIRLVDFKLEFGFDTAGEITLGDEISPDTCRLWDMETDRKLDKDVFRRDLGDLMEAYREVADRLGVTIPQEQ